MLSGRQGTQGSRAGACLLRRTMDGWGKGTGTLAVGLPEQPGSLSPERAVRKEVSHRSLSLCLDPRLGAWISHFETHGTGSRHF